MHQLKALIWKAYKVRLRSPLTTALDFAGPLVIISIYIVLKISLGSLSSPSVPAEQEVNHLFRRGTGERTGLLNPKTDLVRYTCTKTLYFSPLRDRQFDPARISQQCGLEIVQVSSRDDVISKLSASLAFRIRYRPVTMEDLNRSNGSQSTDGCFRLPGRSEPLYELGLVLDLQDDRPRLEVHSTDSAGHRVIYQPYTQGSNYNEYRFPQSDLNTALHLLEICIRTAVFGLGSDLSLSSANSTNATAIRLRAFPVIAASQVTPILFLVFQLFANLCNGIATVMRISDDNESGLRHYIRLTGVPAIYYWISQLIAIFVHMSFQSFIMAVILSWPSSSDLLDPISEANITLRWLILLTYGLAINVYSLFIGSIFYKTSLALLVTCLIAVSYSMYPLTFMVQWSPYKFSPYKTVINLMLANPVSNYEALLNVLYAIQLQSADSLGWSHLGSRIIGGGMSNWSAAQLWLLLILQTIFWFLITILVDQFLYCSSLWPTGIMTSLCELISFGALVEPNKQDQHFKSTKSVKSSKSSANMKSTPLRSDLNRVCCSLRDISIHGQSTLSAFTIGDPLKFKGNRTLPNNHKGKLVSKSQYLIDRLDQAQPKDQHDQHDHQSIQHHRRALSKTITHTLHDESILLDQAIRQHIGWHKTHDSLENINMDFRLNQISFILGSTSLKELFFSAILGLRTLQSGHMMLDGRKYTSSSMFMARRHIGYLSERDVFLNEMSIFENLQLFGSLRDPSYTAYDSESSFLLNLLHLSKRRDHLPASLTYRSARKLALAVAAVGHTKLLLLVEPTLSLHWRPRCQVLSLLKKYKSIRSIIVDTSDVDEAASFGDRIVLLSPGQIDLDGSPATLDRLMNCGYWLVFEPVSSSRTSATQMNGLKQVKLGEQQQQQHLRLGEISNDNIKALETLTSEVFKQDKIDRLDATWCSISQELLNTTKKTNMRPDPDKDREGQHPSTRQQVWKNNIPTTAKIHLHAFPMLQTNTPSDVSNAGEGLESRPVRRGSCPGDQTASGRQQQVDKMKPNHDGGLSHRYGILLRVRHSSKVHQALCTILKMFNQHGVIHGFRLAQLNYESLEDVLVSKMSKAVYPNLPPDMLISLQHRAQTYRANQQQKLIGSSHSHNLSSSSSVKPATPDKQRSDSSVRVRECSSDLNTIKLALFEGGWNDLVRDRLSPNNEIFRLLLTSFLALFWVFVSLWAVHRSLMAEDVIAVDRRHSFQPSVPGSLLENNNVQQITQTGPVDYGTVNELYKHRVGFYVIAKSSHSEPQEISQLARWPANPKLTGLIKPDLRDSDALFVAKAIQASKDQVASMVFLDIESGQTSVLFEPHLAQSMLAGLKAALNYRMILRSSSNISLIDKSADLTSIDKLHTLKYHFLHSWHEIMLGFKNRRFFYAIGFAISEGIVIGSLVLAPIRHRLQAQTDGNFHMATYWLRMGLFDSVLSLLLITGYTILIACMEDISSMYSMGVTYFALALYKFSALPVAYLVSLIADSALTGFSLILLSYTTIGWAFSAHLLSFIEWILYHEGYLYIVAKWATLIFPISSLIESLTNTIHIARVDKLCPEVPAFTATAPLTALDGVQKETITDELLNKVNECLRNGKRGISTDMFHQRKFGIFWCVCLIIVFGVVAWLFLLFSERVFGLFARKFRSRKSIDPMKALIRSSEPSHSLFKWDRERDRLVSDYIRCLNEVGYVKRMAQNCIYLRLWLKPMSTQTPADKRLTDFLEPLVQLGQPKGDIQIELKTTLQIFIRIGSEATKHKVDRVQLIETYAKFVKDNGQSLVKVAVVDWSAENLYKILLHGHYNTKQQLSNQLALDT